MPGATDTAKSKRRLGRNQQRRHEPDGATGVFAKFSPDGGKPLPVVDGRADVVFDEHHPFQPTGQIPRQPLRLRPVRLSLQVNDAAFHPDLNLLKSPQFLVDGAQPLFEPLIGRGNERHARLGLVRFFAVLERQRVGSARRRSTQHRQRQYRR